MTRNRFPVVAQRALILAITGFFWFVWLYLLAPLASLLLWLVGIHFFAAEMFERGGYQALIHQLVNYGVASLAIFCVVVAWMIWNKRRYGSHNTRTMQPPYVSVSELSEFSGVKVSEISRLQSSKQATAGFDDRNRLLVRSCRGMCAALVNSEDQAPTRQNHP